MIRDHLKAEGRIGAPELHKLLSDAIAVLKKEPNLIMLEEPVVIIGDIHGQFFDMIHMFEKVIDIRPQARLLFLGDYVDRGLFSIEVCVFLLSLKLSNPEDVVLLRGNHESRAMTTHFTFRNDVLRQYGDESIYEKFMECFDCLPVSCVVNEDYLCMHGGVSPILNDVKDIHRINRFEEPGLSGLLCDLLWSDPVDDGIAQKISFMENKERDCSVKFGLKPVKTLLKKSNFLSVVRAHQVQIDGYKMHRWRGKAIPSGITVFSAPNYCDQMGNKGAYIRFNGSDMVPHFTQFEAAPHPDVKAMHYASNMFSQGF